MRTTASVLLRVSPIADAVLIALVVTLAADPALITTRTDLLLRILVVPTVLAALHFFGVYESQRLESIAGVARKVLSAMLVTFAGLAGASWALGRGSDVLLLAGVCAGGALLVMAEKGFAYSVLHTLRRFGFDRRRVCVVGTWETARELARRFAQSPAWGFHVACVGVGPAESRQFLRFPDGASLGGSLTAVLDSHVVDEVLLAVPAEDVVAERSTLALCDQYGVMGRLLLRPPGGEYAAPAQVDDLCGAPALAIGGPRYDDRLMAFKRVVDVVLSLVLLVGLLPLLAAIAVMVKLSSPGPVIFRQQRFGLHGRRFWFYKFRTMVDGAETMLPAVAHRSITGGPIFKDPIDVRVTRVGRILRRFSLDELPQLINVIGGQMSLVGPRPLPLHEAAAVVGVNRRRFSMRPGLTCLWQVNGRSDVDYVTWMQYDLEYVDRWSLMLDLKLLLRTIPVVFTGRGAY